MNTPRKTLARRATLATAIVGMVATGSLAIATSASASTSAPYIRYGSHGPGVTCVQLALNWDGAELTVDGIDGPGTTSAIRQFQTEHGLPADGIVGPKTGNYIYWIDVHEVDANCYAYVPTSS